MSGSDLTKKISEISLEKRREYQFQVLKAWSSGVGTGRECIEEILSLENVVFLSSNEIQKIKEKYEQTNDSPENHNS